MNTENHSAPLTMESTLLSSNPSTVRKNFLRYYPWIIMILCAFFLFYKYLLQVSPSVMTQELMKEFGVTGVGLGNLAATYFYAYLVAQLFVGPLLDRYSPRYLTVVAIGICAFGALLFARAETLLAAEMARVLMGVGTAFATVSYMKMSALWFRQDKVAMVDGLLATAAMMGALCGQVPLTLLVTTVGWRDGILYCGFFGLILTFIFFIVVQDKKDPLDLTKLSHLPMKSSIHFADVLDLLKDKKNWLLAFYSGLAFTPIAVLGGLWGNPFFEAAYHLTPEKSAYFTSLIFIGVAIGSPLFGYVAGWLGDSIKVMILGTVLAFIALTGAIYLTGLPLWLLGSLLFIFGLGTGVFMLSFPLGKEMNSIRLAATVVALINTGDALLGSLTEPLIGKIVDIYWNGEIVNGAHYFSVKSYQIALSLLPVYLLIGLVCLILLRKLKSN